MKILSVFETIWIAKFSLNLSIKPRDRLQTHKQSLCIWYRRWWCNPSLYIQYIRTQNLHFIVRYYWIDSNGINLLQVYRNNTSIGCSNQQSINFLFYHFFPFFFTLCYFCVCCRMVPIHTRQLKDECCLHSNPIGWKAHWDKR